MIVRVAVVSATLLGILSVRLASVQPVTVADEIPAVAVKMLVIVDQHGPDRNAAHHNDHTLRNIAIDQCRIDVLQTNQAVLIAIVKGGAGSHHRRRY